MNSFLLVVLCLFLSILSVLSQNVDPIQQRIALLPNGMTVSWSTSSALPSAPSVHFGTSPSSLPNTATGFSNHYESATTYFHHVELQGLKPSTKYYWKPDQGTSNVLSFTTAPDLSSGQPGNFSVAIYGDLGIDNSVDTLNLLRRLAARNEVELFWHVGDLSYADDHSSTPYTYEQIYEGWMTNMTDIWDETPYMFCPGNHENSGGGGSTASQSNFTSYRERFHMPFQYSQGPNNMFYSFDYGLVHFINIDTEVSFPGAPEGGKEAGPWGVDQEKWLRADLDKATANRANVPWILISGHRQFFATVGWLAPQMTYFMPIFKDYDIDGVFYGHIHYYERLWPLDTNGTICQQSYEQPTCPVYVVTGAAGNIEGLTKTTDKNPFSASGVISEFGVGVLHVTSATQLTWQFLRSSDGMVIDAVTINKKHSVPEPAVQSSVQ